MKGASFPTHQRQWASDTVPATFSSTSSPGTEEFVEVTLDLQDDDTIILRNMELASTAITVDDGAYTSASTSRSPTIRKSSSNTLRQFSQGRKVEAVAKAKQFSTLFYGTDTQL
ncbi:hypothetical protein GOBAR_DD27938 [Gossypium barbadense]|nr:hypothetical protein GOBAR_DD27938 [Gossypium barbadense]